MQLQHKLMLVCAATAGHAAPVVPAPAAAAPPVTHGLRIYSTGHSFHFGFPPALAEIALGAGLADHRTVGISSIGGSHVSQHWQSQPVRDAVTAGQVDVLLTTPIYLPDDGVWQLASCGTAHQPDFRLTVMEFWLPYDNYEPRNYTHGPAGSPTEWIKPPLVNHDAATGESLRAMHARYFAEWDALVADIDQRLGRPAVCVVPAGQAVIALREKIIAGTAPGLRSQWDLFTDELGHPKPVLTVLMGYLHFAVIYRRSPVGLAVPKELHTAKPETTAALNTLLQELAWDAVLAHPLSGLRVPPAAP